MTDALYLHKVNIQFFEGIDFIVSNLTIPEGGHLSHCSSSLCQRVVVPNTVSVGFTPAPNVIVFSVEKIEISKAALDDACVVRFVVELLEGIGV